MKKNDNKIFISSAAAVVMLSACAPAQQPAETSASSTAAQTAPATNAASSVSESAAQTEALTGHDAVINTSLLSAGNGERFRNVLKKAENGEEITVGYIGGSITEGYTVKPEECWAYLTYRWLCDKYPAATINYVNAGLSGTPSSLAVVRVERDLLAPYGDPDIIFIEFAVNDAQNEICRESYESLVRRMYELENEPAVALLFMRTDTGYSCQEQQSKIGYKYGLPMVSINDGLSYAIENDIMQWSDYSNDGAHPNPVGCKLIAEMIEYMYGRILDGDNDEAADADIETPLYGDAYQNMHLLDSNSLTPVSMGEYSTGTTVASFPAGWSRKGGDNTGITFDMDFESLFMVYHCDNKKKFGTAEVYIDGEWASEVKSSASDGWSNPVPQLIRRSDSGAAHHTVEVKMKDGNEDTYFGILAFGITD